MGSCPAPPNPLRGRWRFRCTTRAACLVRLARRLFWHAERSGKPRSQERLGKGAACSHWANLRAGCSVRKHPPSKTRVLITSTSRSGFERLIGALTFSLAKRESRPHPVGTYGVTPGKKGLPRGMPRSGARPPSRPGTNTLSSSVDLAPVRPREGPACVSLARRDLQVVTRQTAPEALDNAMTLEATANANAFFRAREPVLARTISLRGLGFGAVRRSEHSRKCWPSRRT